MHEKLFGSIFIKSDIRNESIICGTIYRSLPHDQIFNDKVKETLESIKTNYKCFIFGDPNYDFFAHDNNMVNNLLNNMLDNSFC